MKKAMVLLAALALLFCSCSSGQISKPSLTDTPTESTDTAPVTTPKTDKPAKEQQEEKEPLFKLSDISVCRFQSSDADIQTYEDVRNEYPDKTVLVWQLSPLIAPPSSQAVNKYLDSLGKEYAVCFLDSPKDFRSSKYSEAISYSTYQETVTERLESGRQIDIIDAFSIYNELSLHGFLEPIDSYLSDTSAGKKLYDLMPENYWKGCRINGNIFGVCSYLTLGKRSGYLVNSVLADQYEYDIAKPILEQTDILEKIKKEPCDTVMTWKGFSQPSEVTTKKCFGGCAVWDDSAKSAASILSDEEYTQTLGTYFELNKMGLVCTNPNNKSYFIFEQNNQYLPTLNRCEPIYSNIGSESVTVPSYFASTSGSCVKQSGSGVGVAASSEYKDLAFDLIAAAYTDPELNNILCYGENYRDCIQNGCIYLSGKDINRMWVFLNPIISIRPGTEPENLSELWVSGLEAAKVSEDIDFTPNLSDFEDTMDAISAASLEMSRKVLTNEYTGFEEYLAEYSKRLDEAGQQVIIDEVNRQYEDYMEHRNG